MAIFVGHSPILPVQRTGLAQNAARLALRVARAAAWVASSGAGRAGAAHTRVRMAAAPAQ
jgi:hypothetical protein